jgi:hypothetical protein
LFFYFFVFFKLVLVLGIRKRNLGVGFEETVVDRKKKQEGKGKYDCLFFLLFPGKTSVEKKRGGIGCLKRKEESSSGPWTIENNTPQKWAGDGCGWVCGWVSGKKKMLNVQFKGGEWMADEGFAPLRSNQHTKTSLQIKKV